MDMYMCCRYCSEGVYVPIERRTMCKKFGLVEETHVCPHFVENPFRIENKRRHTVDFSKYEKENYSIDVEEEAEND